MRLKEVEARETEAQKRIHDMEERMRRMEDIMVQRREGQCVHPACFRAEAKHHWYGKFRWFSHLAFVLRTVAGNGHESCRYKVYYTDMIHPSPSMISVLHSIYRNANNMSNVQTWGEQSPSIPYLWLSPAAPISSVNSYVGRSMCRQCEVVEQMEKINAQLRNQGILGHVPPSYGD